MVLKPFNSLPLSIILMIAVPTLIAWVIGYFIFKSRVKGVYFSIISQALTWAMYTLLMDFSLIQTVQMV